jgi:hypothetical protein
VCVDHPREPFEGLEPLPFELLFPLLEEAPGPAFGL